MFNRFYQHIRGPVGYVYDLLVGFLQCSIDFTNISAVVYDWRVIYVYDLLVGRPVTILVLG